MVDIEGQGQRSVPLLGGIQEPYKISVPQRHVGSAREAFLKRDLDASR